MLPPPGAGLVTEKPAQAVELPQEVPAPRRSLRARTERTYVDDGEFEEEEFMSDSDGGATPTYRT